MAKKAKPESLDHADLHALARLDFGVFVELAFPVLHPGKKIDHAGYLDVLYALMTACGNGRKDRVTVNLPPGFMKSLIISIFYTAWRLGVDPTRKFVCISYGDDLAHKHNVATRMLMQSNVYKAIFPGTVLEKKAEDHLTTTKGGYRYATAVSSDITGFRPNEIIVDDPIEPDDGANENVKLKLREWISTSVMTRFEETADSCFILVMHRVAPDDLSCTLGQQEGWFTLALPLIAPEPKKYTGKNGTVFLERLAGDVLHPGRFPPEAIEKLKQEVAPHAFEAQYQQAPTLGGSGMFSIDKLHYYDKPPSFERKIHSWDIGVTTTGNPSVCTKWGVTKSKDGHDIMYLTDIIRIQQQLPDVRDTIKAQDMRDKPDLIVLDHRGAGMGLYQQFEQDRWRHVKYVSGKGLTNESKIERFARAQIHIYDGLVRFPQHASFMPKLLYDLATFPDLAEDDLIDSITQVVAFRETVMMFARQNRRPDG